MVTKPTQNYGGVLDLVPTDAHDLVGVRVGLPSRMSYHTALFISVVIEQRNPHLMCRQEVYLKNSVVGNWL